jgi:tetratricopeptide (TPR) repeat protein
VKSNLPVPPNAEKMNELANQTESLQNQIDQLSALVNNSFQSSAVLLTILGIIITIGIASLAIVGYITDRNRKAADSLRGDVESVNQSRLDLEIEDRLQSYENGLRQEVIALSGLMRELVAGELCYDRSDYEGALEHYSKVWAADHGNEEAGYYIGRSLTNLNRVDDAERIFKTLLDDNPNNFRAQRGLALALRFNDRDRARNIALSAIGMRDISVDILHDLQNEYALLLRDNGQYPDCLMHHEAAYRLKRDTVTEYFIGLSEMLCGQDRGKRRIIAACEHATIDLADRTIRPLWHAVIQWSAAVLLGKEEDAQDELKRIENHIDESKYMRLTVGSHLSVVSKLAKIENPFVA